MSRRKLLRGTSADALLLTFIKLVTMSLSFVVTRLLSQYLTKHDYGTYSTILLIVTTVYSVTILGMVDGVNYFYCRSKDEKEREAYLSTIYALQCIIGVVVGAAIMLLTSPLCAYFDNADLRRLMIFAAALPTLQNLISMTQVLLVSVGKARMIAVRNLVVSLMRLAAVIVVICLIRDVMVILLTTLVLDVGQMLLFLLILRKNRCPLRLKSVDFSLLRTIFGYCAPMAVYTLLYSLNRDCDKYLIGLLTDTETLAMYSNASKVLPFDVIAGSFITVLLPQITRLIAQNQKTSAVQLYRSFLEITYISTTILCCAVLASSPQVMQLLYSKKYLDGLAIFCVYVLVDLLRFTNITLILSAAGKTKKLMRYSLAALVGNAAANVALYWLLGIIGPAVATLLTSFLLGICLMRSGARELECRLRDFFDLKYLSVFLLMNAALCAAMYAAQRWLVGQGLSYLLVLGIVFGGFAACMGLLHYRRFVRAMKQVNALCRSD